MNLEIPRKSMFKQDEVCQITGVKPYVLRFWESEFEEISPMISSTGSKLYEHKDLEFIMSIKRLLFEQKYTIEKAKAFLRGEKVKAPRKKKQEQPAVIEEASVQTSSAIRDEVVQGHRDVDFDKIDEVRDLLNDIITQTNSIQSTYSWI